LESAVEDAQSRRLKSAVADLSIDNELLREKIARLEGSQHKLAIDLSLVSCQAAWSNRLTSTLLSNLYGPIHLNENWSGAADTRSFGSPDMSNVMLNQSQSRHFG
jgi:hypothetical protein